MSTPTTLTYGILQSRLQIANCCAGVKGGDIIVKQNKGIGCKKDKEKVQLILDLVDSIKCYINTDLTDDVFNDEITCLETNEIISILNKLDQLCDGKCRPYVNFEES